LNLTTSDQKTRRKPPASDVGISRRRLLSPVKRLYGFSHSGRIEQYYTQLMFLMFFHVLHGKTPLDMQYTVNIKSVCIGIIPPCSRRAFSASLRFFNYSDATGIDITSKLSPSITWNQHSTDPDNGFFLGQ